MVPSWTIILGNYFIGNERATLIIRRANATHLKNEANWDL